MNNLKFLPFLLMDSSCQLLDELLKNPEKPKYLEEASLQYYIIPYRAQRRKYFRKLFENAPDDIYDLLDKFEDAMKPFITNMYNEILLIFNKEFEDINNEDKIVLTTFHCNAVLLRFARQYQKFINKIPASQITDLIEYNTQILKKLPITSSKSIDLNKYVTIKNSLKTLSKQFISFFKN